MCPCQMAAGQRWGRETQHLPQGACVGAAMPPVPKLHNSSEPASLSNYRPQPNVQRPCAAFTLPARLTAGHAATTRRNLHPTTSHSTPPTSWDCTCANACCAALTAW